MKPLILITNDDGVASRGLLHLASIAQEYGEVIVMAPDHNASGVSTSITSTRPLRVNTISQSESYSVYSCDGTPADCVKMGIEHFCPRTPDLVLSGINYGSNASINVIYSGTIGAVLEACLNGFPAIGFSLLNHNPAADFDACTPTIRHILSHVLQHPLPDFTALNVNIPRLPKEKILGIRICHEANACWNDSFEKRIDPQGRPYWWLTGKFVCDDPSEESDEWALAHGYVSIVPIHCDFTHYPTIDKLKKLYD